MNPKKPRMTISIDPAGIQKKPAIPSFVFTSLRNRPPVHEPRPSPIFRVYKRNVELRTLNLEHRKNENIRPQRKGSFQGLENPPRRHLVASARSGRNPDQPMSQLAALAVRGRAGAVSWLPFAPFFPMDFLDETRPTTPWKYRR